MMLKNWWATCCCQRCGSTFSRREKDGSLKILGVNAEVALFFTSLTSGRLDVGTKKTAAKTRPSSKSKTTMVERITTARPLGWDFRASDAANLRESMSLI
jgi:hypothetical protein